MNSEHGMEPGEERSEEAKGKKLNDEMLMYMKKRSESALPHYTAKLKTYVNIQQKHRRADAARSRRSDNYCDYCKCSDKRRALYEAKDGANPDNAFKKKQHDDKNAANKSKERDASKRPADKTEKSRSSTPGSRAGTGDPSDAGRCKRRRRSCRRKRRCRRRRRSCSRRRRRRSCRRRRRCRPRRRRC